MITHRSEKCKNGVDCKTQINGVIYSVVNQLTFHQQFWYQLGIRIPNCELKCGVGEDSWESWTARRSNQSILKEISPEYSLEGLMMKLKLQYFGHLMQRIDSLEKTLMLGKIEGGRRGRRGLNGWMASPTQRTWVWASSRRWWRTGKPGVLQSMGSQRVKHNWATEQQLLWVKCSCTL